MEGCVSWGSQGSLALEQECRGETQSHHLKPQKSHLVSEDFGNGHQTEVLLPVQK